MLSKKHLYGSELRKKMKR